MIDRQKYFAAIRPMFGGSLGAETVRGNEAILTEWERRRLTDLRHLAYMLATVKRECGVNMLPVREGFGKTDAASRGHVGRQRYRYAVEVNGQVYYGRGLVQLTWDFNYKTMGELLGIDLLRNPDLALDPAIAAKIMFEGMIRGSFTGKKLADYFSATKTDWRNARRIINGVDHADEIADVAKKFWAALKAAERAPTPIDVIHPKPLPAPKKGVKTEIAVGTVIAGGGAVAVSQVHKSGASAIEIGLVAGGAVTLALIIVLGIRKLKGK